MAYAHAHPLPLFFLCVRLFAISERNLWSRMAKNMMADAGWKWGALTTDTLSKKGKYVSYCWFREELTHGREDSGSGKQTDYASRGLKLWQTYAVKRKESGCSNATKPEHDGQRDHVPRVRDQITLTPKRVQSK